MTAAPALRHAPPSVKTVPPSVANSVREVVDLCAALGLHLDEWQQEVLAAFLGERRDGSWAARVAGLSTPRQNGKSEIIVARALAGILLFGEELIILSAHEASTAREIFKRLTDIIEANPSLEKRVKTIYKAGGRESVAFHSGQKILLKARTLSGGRGFSADCLLLDEAQELPMTTWAALLPTMSAMENPQALLFGTPPTDMVAGEVFAKLRQTGLKDEPGGASAWVEWSAEPEDDIDDEASWAKANPAYGIRISREAIEAERAAMSDHQFAMERLGIWASASSRGVIPTLSWDEAADPESTPDDLIALGVEVGPDLAWASVALAGLSSVGNWHIELDEDQNTRGRGVHWVVPHVERLVTNNPGIRAVVVDVSSPIKALLVQRGPRWFLRRADGSLGVQVHALKVAELGAGCASLLSGIVTGDVRHIDQPQLSAAALTAGKRPLGDTGTWVWSRRSADSDITQIQSATYALIGSQLERPVKPGASRVINSDSPSGTTRRSSRRSSSRTSSSRRR